MSDRPGFQKKFNQHQLPALYADDILTGKENITFNQVDKEARTYPFKIPREIVKEIRETTGKFTLAARWAPGKFNPPGSSDKRISWSETVTLTVICPPLKKRD